MAARKHEAESGDAKELAEILDRMRPKKAAKFYLELRAMRLNTPTPLPAVASAAPANEPAPGDPDVDDAEVARLLAEDAACLEAKRARKGH